MKRITVNYGQVVEVTGTFSAKGEPVDPDVVICSIEAPDGSISNPTATKVSVGVYRALFTPPDPGGKEQRFEAVMDGYGENQAAGPPLMIKVLPREVPRPAE